MKINYAIVSSNDNPLYLDFWEVVKNLWINKIGIKPILVKIDDSDHVEDFGNYIIHKIKKVKGVDTEFQSQIARLYIPKFYKDEVCLTSDIDMLPLSKRYFVSDVDQYSDDSLLIFSSDAYGGIGRYPMCYNAAKGSLFENILKLDDNFEKFCLRLLSMNLKWDTDEIFFGRMVDLFGNQDRIIKLKRGWIEGIAKNRIDRALWGYSIENIKNDLYFDSHSLRPYSEYKHHIDNLIENYNNYAH